MNFVLLGCMSNKIKIFWFLCIWINMSAMPQQYMNTSYPYFIIWYNTKLDFQYVSIVFRLIWYTKKSSITYNIDLFKVLYLVMYWRYPHVKSVKWILNYNVIWRLCQPPQEINKTYFALGKCNAMRVTHVLSTGLWY